MLGRLRGPAREDHAGRSFDDTLRLIIAERAASRTYGLAPLKDSPAAQALLGAAPEEQIDIVLAALAVSGRRVDREHPDYRLVHAAGELTAALLRRNLPWDEPRLAALLGALIALAEGRGSRRPYLVSGSYGDPVNGVLRAVERVGDGSAAPADLHRRLRRVRELLFGSDTDAEYRRTTRRIDALLGVELPDTGPLVAVDDQWARALLAARAENPEARDRVLSVATTATANKPSKTFKAARDQLVGDLGQTGLGELAAELLAAAAAIGPDARFGQVPPETGDALRGLCWLAGGGGEEAARALGTLALWGWKKVPQHGPLCQKAANAAIGELAEMAEGAAQLGRIRAQLKQPAAVRAVDAAIDRAAERLGIPRAEFEERVVPQFDLDQHARRVVKLGSYSAEIELAFNATCTLSFHNSEHKKLKSVPAAVKAEHAAQLAELKRAATDIKLMAAAQKIRLERLLLDDRTWSYETWRERYLDHGLVGAIARRLIWTLDGVSVIHPDGRLTRHDSSPPPSPTPASSVRLWHPVDADPSEVHAWRRFLEEREITQPFKQAHREVYLLTAAEEQTRTYSNRFAAHILRQHQMAALARARGWRYALQGAWDAPDEKATLELPQHHITASFWVERPWDTQDWNDTGVFNHVLSDQVRFYDPAGDAVALDTLAPRVFSEVMRDVDLFVGVTSIGNDPTWADNGERLYRDYWRGYAFGELTEQADIRRDLLARLLPKLVIRDVARIDGRYLRVDGKLRTYRIHLGSGNILMEPNDQYLCIVPSRGTSPADKVFLPFEGDQVLALILSKAFLLAKDDNIDDPTIVSQITRRGSSPVG
jgi:hypothetical protein